LIVFSSVSDVLSLSRPPLIPKTAQLLPAIGGSTVPLSNSKLVITPPATKKVAFICVAAPLNRHAMPLIEFSNLIPRILTLRLSILGRNPLKPAYVMCQGSDSGRNLALAAAPAGSLQAFSLTTALVMWPIRLPTTLANVLL